MCRLARVALLSVFVLSTGCSSGDDPEEVSGPVEETPATPTGPAAVAPSDEWACVPDERSGFVTDPVVYPRSQSLEEVAAEFGVETFNVDSNDGRRASVTFWNEGGFIVARMDYHRGESSGWWVERGRTCFALAEG
jgi:hypothetical protein